MKHKYNPFKPGSIVHPGMFSGRVNEINSIESYLFQTIRGNPQHFLIQGERGIGKSSLILYSKYLAEQVFVEENGFDILTFKIDLENNYTVANIVNKIIKELKISIDSKSFLGKQKQDVLNFFKKIETSYFSYKEQKLDNYEVINNLALLLKKCLSKEENKGIFILVDEDDKPQASANLGALLKLLSEKLTELGCNRVCFGLAGLPETIDRLREGHESVVRIFHVLKLKILSLEERLSVIDIGIKEACEKGRSIKIDKKAKENIAKFSEGYPYFLQQFAYNSFEEDKDDYIDLDDVERGIFDKNKEALKQLGEKLFNNIMYNQISSEDYRQLLYFMAVSSEVWFSRKSIIEKLSKHMKEYTINNALKALKDKGIIIVSRNRGEYKLPSLSFKVWLSMICNNNL